MKTIILQFCIFVLPICSAGQANQTITLKNNKVSSEDIKPEFQYIFHDFRSGSVCYRDNKIINCQLNYNFLMDEILFINAKGEKMAIADPKDLSYVLIANRKFIPTPKGYYEIIESGDISLVYKWICRISPTKAKGALGLSTDAPSIYQENRFSFDNREWKMDVDKEALASVEVIPYLKIKSKFVSITGAQSYYKTFRGKNSEIKIYLEQNPVNFKKEADLRRITRFCNSLVE